MAQRYYMCPIIGTGAEEDGYRPALSDLNIPGSLPVLSYSAIWKKFPIGHPQAGRPVFSWAIVIVEAVDHDSIAAVAGNDKLPDLTLDARLSTLVSVDRNAMLTRMVARGISTTGIGVNTPYRDVIRRIGVFHEVAFSEDNFGIH